MFKIYVLDDICYFYDRIAENVSFSFALKTDDDCFVNLDSILQVSKSFAHCRISQIAYPGFHISYKGVVVLFSVISDR